MTNKSSVFFVFAVASAVAICSFVLPLRATRLQDAQQQKQGAMPGMDMGKPGGGQDSDAAKGANMAMSGRDMDMGAHMFMTDLRPANTGDEKRAAEALSLHELRLRPRSANNVQSCASDFAALHQIGRWLCAGRRDVHSSAPRQRRRAECASAAERRALAQTRESVLCAAGGAHPAGNFKGIWFSRFDRDGRGVPASRRTMGAADFQLDGPRLSVRE